jgi:hypothetical protein
MRYRLRTYEITPTGGYPFSEGGHNFPSQPMIEAQAKIVSNYRKGNGMPRASLAESLADVDCYQCQRLGNMPQWCIPADSANQVALPATAPIIAPPCKGCGAPVQS